MGMTGNGFIEILRKIKESNNLENYIDINGYDLVIVDYHHGADYIQRNALMVETVVEWANAQKAANGSVSKNMLLGVSMGGLVGRYALRDMELKSKNHDTELFVSFDAPHLGANLPYGMQLAIDQAWWVVNGISLISSDSEAKKFPRLAYEMQHNPAARQMVVYQTGHISGDYPSLFNDFQNTLASMGMPQNCRNVSVVNGSDVGHNQNFNAGDKIFELNANAALLAPNFNAALLAVTLKVYFGLDFQADVDAWFTPATSATWRKVYDGLYTKKVLWTTVWKHHMISEASGSTVPYDNAPGGTFSIELDGGAGQNISGLQIFKPEFNHIPSVSSIYLNVPERYDLNYNLSSQSILSKTGFNNFVANPYDAVSNRFNTSHIEINATTANWAIEEIGLNRVNTTINILSNNSFNFTNLTTDRISTSSFTIHQNGKLKVNTNTTSGYLNSGLSAPQQGSSFCLYTNANDCGTVYLEVQNGGEIVLGDNSTGNIGYLYLTRNSILKMKSGSTLTINNNSKLIIEPGAKIIYESGAIINLNGTNAVFEVQGNGILEIADNTIFSFNGNGFFRFNNTTSQTLAFGTNFHFYLNGSSQNNKLLELTNNAILSFPYGTGNTRKFTATNCNIDILSGSIEVKSDLNMSDVKISGGIYSTLKTFGQDPVDIENCTFQNVTYYATQSQEQENEIFLTINSCTFENSGVSVYDKGFSLSNSTFDESYLAVENLTLPSTVYNTLFNNANINTSVYYTNISNAVPLILDNVSINGLNDNGDYGILNTGGIVKLKCTDVNATISAIALYTGAKIDMSTQNGGIYNRNLLSKSSSTSSEDYPLIETYEAEMIYLDEGQNVLKKLVNAKYIKGTFNNTNNIEITAENNKWHPQLYASSTTPLASNFALSSITNNIPVDIDYSPISSATLEACGSQSSMMMSGSDPCDGPFGCPNSMNVLDNCPSCSNVKIGGVAINKKLKKVFREMAEDTLKVKLNHNLNRLDSILNFEVTANLPAVENLKDRAYSNYIELYQTKISQSVQSSLSNISLTNKVMAVTNARLNKAIAHNDTSRIVKYLLSKTSLYLNKNDDYTTPLNLLNTALNYTDPNTAMYAFIQSQICVITTESLYVNRMISSSEFDSLKQECKVLYSIKPSASRVVYQEEKESLLNNSETELHLYPNPANTDLNIILTNTPESNYNYKIMDVSGRTILKHHIEQTSNFNINISELPQGVYMFEIESGGILKTGKFVIVR